MLNQVVYKEKVSKQTKENTQNWGNRLQFLFSKSWMYWKTFTYSCFKQHWWHEICQLFVKVSYCSRRLGKCRYCWSLRYKCFLKNHAILWFYNNADVNSMDGLVDSVIRIFSIEILYIHEQQYFLFDISLSLL